MELTGCILIILVNSRLSSEASVHGGCYISISHETAELSRSHQWQNVSPMQETSVMQVVIPQTARENVDSVWMFLQTSAKPLTAVWDWVSTSVSVKLLDNLISG